MTRHAQSSSWKRNLQDPVPLLFLDIVDEPETAASKVKDRLDILAAPAPWRWRERVAVSIEPVFNRSGSIG